MKNGRIIGKVPFGNILVVREAEIWKKPVGEKSIFSPMKIVQTYIDPKCILLQIVLKQIYSVYGRLAGAPCERGRGLRGPEKDSR